MYASLVFVLLVSLTLQYHCCFATYYPQQDSIMGQSGLSYRLTQPQRYIDCRDESGSCSITLNVTYMQTMTVYEYDSDINSDVGGRRGDDGYVVSITSTGDLQFHFEPPSTSVYGADYTGEFLYPILADGSLERRPVIAINNQVPGPTIIGRNGQNLRVTVVNNLATESISVHWHGQHVVGTPWMDGVAQLTQCPITSHTNFTYNFTLDQVGTHWYHAHNGAQRTDGLFGALIVSDTSEFDGITIPGPDFQDLPERHTLTFVDWQRSDSISVLETIASGSRFPDPVNPNQLYLNTLIYGGSESAPMPFVSGLINGAGWRYTPGPPNGNQALCTRESAQNTPLAVFNVTQGNRYRFRLIGAQSAYAFRFSIQGHKMTLLSSDGVPVQETVSQQEELDYIIINSGERYDVLVQADLPSPRIDTGYYWMIAETLEDPDMLEETYCVIGHRAYAILHYTDQAGTLTWPPRESEYNPIDRCPQNTPCFMANCPFEEFPTQSTQSITCVNVRDMQRRASQAIPDKDVSEPTFLNFGFAGIPTVQSSSINGRHFRFPPSPVTTQYSDLTEIWNDNFCLAPDDAKEPQGRRCTHTYRVENPTVELVLMNYFPNMSLNASQAHPVHLHGHHFRVVEVQYGNCTAEGCTNDDIVCGNDFCDESVDWSNDKKQRRPIISNVNGSEKDTVIVPPGGYVVIRFERNNPGWWFLHCHIEPHQLEGMAMVINESVGIPGPPANFPRCNNYPTSSTPSTSPPSSTATTAEMVLGAFFVAAICLL